MDTTFVDGKAERTVTGLNVLHQLRRKQYTTTWTNKRDSEIARDIGQRTDHGRKRFPLPIVIDQQALGNEKPIPLVTQHNQYDIDFLFQRARMRGYVVFVQEEDKVRNRPRQLYFGPSQAGMVPGLRDVSFELKWGASLMEFKPKVTTANQVASVTVRGWHRTRRTPISRTVTLDDERLTVNRDLHRILNACEAREERIHLETQGGHRLVMEDSPGTVEITTTGGQKIVMKDLPAQITLSSKSGSTVTINDAP